MVEAWVIKYQDGKMVGHGGAEAAEVDKARQFSTEQEATSMAVELNKGLQESHLGYATVARVS